MSLLTTRPSLRDICTKVLGHANAGDGLRACFTGAIASYFDSVYVGSKDRASNFGMYGSAEITLSVASEEWAYNATDVRTFTVTPNHSTWKFHSTSDKSSDWTVEVWSSDGMEKLGDYNTTTLWPSGAIVKVKPNTNNTGGSNRNCTLYCGTYNDYLIAGGGFSGTQTFEVNINVYPQSASGWTVVLNDWILDLGSNQLWVSFTVSGMATSPRTVYYGVLRNGVIKASGTIASVRNDVNKQVWITLNEYAVNGNYYFDVNDGS